VTVVGRLDHDKHATLIPLNYRQSSTRCLQQCLQLSFNKAILLSRVSDVAQWRPHVKCAARLTLEQNVISAKMYFRRFPCGGQLFQVTVAEFALFVPFIADGLRVSNPLGYRR
jgi:hypothetical protein